MPAETSPLPPLPAAAPQAAPEPRRVESVRPAPPISGEKGRADLEAALRKAAQDRHPERPVRVSLDRDEATDHVVVRVEDPETGEVVAQYPPEELLRFYAAARNQSGAIVDLKS